MGATQPNGQAVNVIESPRSASVLFFLDGNGGETAGLGLAAEAARRLDAGLHAVYLETHPFDLAAASGGDGVVESYRARKSERATRKAAQISGVPLEWEIIAGNRQFVTKAIVDRAVVSDLVVVDWGVLKESGGDWTVELFAQIPLLAGRPTLFIPKRHRGEEFGKCPMVAWNESREASRAVNDAMPFLESARDVMVLGVETGAGEHQTGLAGEPRLAAYLSHHGIRVQLCKSYVPGADAGETIAQRAAELDTDLLVMGAHGHGRLGRVVLGPATRYLLDNMPVPVLMSH